uniref:Uncharacterized protein n=1 Tax=Heterorhabditis bacteriophora TaxID=37862 RepID=A0A1I7WWI7_HETBA
MHFYQIILPYLKIYFQEEIDAKASELRSICQSIMSKLYSTGQQSAPGRTCRDEGQGFPGGNRPDGYSRPTVEEVD